MLKFFKEKPIMSYVVSLITLYYIAMISLFLLGKDLIYYSGVVIFLGFLVNLLIYTSIKSIIAFIEYCDYKREMVKLGLRRKIELNKYFSKEFFLTCFTCNFTSTYIIKDIMDYSINGGHLFPVCICQNCDDINIIDDRRIKILFRRYNNPLTYALLNEEE